MPRTGSTYNLPAGSALHCVPGRGDRADPGAVARAGPVAALVPSRCPVGGMLRQDARVFHLPAGPRAGLSPGAAMAYLGGVSRESFAP